MYLISYNKLITEHRSSIYFNNINPNSYVNININFTQTISLIQQNKEHYNLFINSINVYNNTYIYHKGLYYYSIGKYNEMLSLLNEINTEHCLILIGNYYRYIVNDTKIMFRYYKKARNLGSKIAIYAIADYYYNIKCPCHGNRSSLNHALKYFYKIENSIAKSCYILGLYYINRHYLEDEMYILYQYLCRKAVKYFQMAIKYGHIESLFSLGLLYMQKHYNHIAYIYFSLGADKGHIAAMYFAGLSLSSIPRHSSMQMLFTEPDMANNIKQYYIKAWENKLSWNEKSRGPICSPIKSLREWYFSTYKTTNQQPIRDYYMCIYSSRIITFVICTKRKSISIPTEIFELLIFNDYIYNCNEDRIYGYIVKKKYPSLSLADAVL